MTDNIEHIIKGCQNRNKRAQKELYDIFKSKMFGVCLRYSENYHDAEDILQDGFLKVYEKINQFENRGSFEGWVRRIMINTALEKHKKETQIIHLHDNMFKEEEESDNFDINSDLTANELLKFVQELSPKYRMVFNLYAIEGYSHKEISELMNISEGTSKSNLSRARIILQEKITSHYKTIAKVATK